MKEYEILLGRTGDVIHTLAGTEHVALHARTRSGKAQPDDALVLTPSGFRAIEELRLGDMVSVPSGGSAPVVGVYPQGEKDIYRVTFYDGRTAESCLDHLWMVWKQQEILLPSYRSLKAKGLKHSVAGGGWSVQPLTEIKRWFDGGLGKASRACVPLPLGVEMPEASLPVPPYVLGALLGDGGLTVHKGPVRLTSADAHIVESVRSLLPDQEIRQALGGKAIDFSIICHLSRDYPTKNELTIKGDARLDLDRTVRQSNLPSLSIMRRPQGCSQVRLVEFRGETLPIEGWAKRIGISGVALRSRLDSGWELEEALLLKRGECLRHRSRRGKLITHAGETLSISEWADRLGCARQIIHNRFRSGWSAEEALTGRPRVPHNNERSPIKVALRGLGLMGLGSHEKFIPECYKRGSLDQRIALLQGLLDTDGSARGPGAEFCSTSMQLAKDVQYLVRSVGGIASLTKRQTHYTHKGEKKPGKPSWRLHIRHPDLARLFSLPRKIARCSERQTDLRLRIRSIEFSRRAPTRCIAVDHPTGLYITNEFVVTHNTSNFSVPNLFEWPGSAVVLDIKGEIFKATAGHRARNLGQEVFVFDPTSRDGRSHCWNPLDAIDRTSIDLFDQIERQSYQMFPEGDGSSNSERFWEPAGRNALMSVCNLVAETPGEAFNFSHIRHLFSRGDYHEVLRSKIMERRAARQPYSQLTVEGISDYLSGHTDMIESIRKTVSTRLAPWQNPRTSAATSRSDFDLRDFRRKPMTLYVRIAPGNMNRMRPLLRLLFEQFVNLNSEVTPEEDPDLKIPVLLWLDEFARLRRMETVAEGLQFLAGFGVRVAIVVQNKAQIRNIYGNNLATDIFDNLGAEVVFGTGDLALAEELEKRLGNNTVMVDQQNKPRIMPGLKLSKQTVSVHPHKVPLRRVQDILRLPRNLQFILRPGMEGMETERICWYEDAHYLGLVQPPPIIPKLTISVPLDDGSIVIPQPQGRRFFVTEHCAP